MKLPICIGFGISRPEHVRMLKPVADGLIVGSAIVRRVAGIGGNSWQKTHHGGTEDTETGICVPC